jgi:hypothetical protein
MPSINPDGQVLVRDWYEKNKGTPYEGGPMPWLFHHYVGHDDNRDYFMLTQKETQVVNDVLYNALVPAGVPRRAPDGEHRPADVRAAADRTRWRRRSTRSSSARPISLAPTCRARLEEAGKLGVGHDMIFDSYWPGGTRNTAWLKNVTGLLTEVASARIATPIYVDARRAAGRREGAARVRPPLELPLTVAGRLVAALRHRRVRAHRHVGLTSRRSPRTAATSCRNLTAWPRAGARRGEQVRPTRGSCRRTARPDAAAKLVDLLLRHRRRGAARRVAGEARLHEYPRARW